MALLVGRCTAASAPQTCVHLRFTRPLQRDTLAAVQRLQAAGADRLVLDLRDNRGGLVTEGIEVRGAALHCGVQGSVCEACLHTCWWDSAAQWGCLQRVLGPGRASQAC